MFILFSLLVKMPVFGTILHVCIPDLHSCLICTCVLLLPLSANPVPPQRPEQLFMVGLPNTYRLPSLELPVARLPSYESVRKRDRQRYIHMLIAHRFGLYGSTLTEVGTRLLTAEISLDSLPERAGLRSNRS